MSTNTFKIGICGVSLLILGGLIVAAFLLGAPEVLLPLATGLPDTFRAIAELVRCID